LIGVVEATVYRVLGRREQDHDDLVQTVFEQVLITLRRKRFARACSLRAWAASIACNVALNTLRARGTDRKYFERDQELDVRLRSVAGNDDPERCAALASQLRVLRAELAALSPEQAQTLLLHEAFGYELAEIAVLTGVSVAAAQSRLVRGRKELRSRLLAAGVRGEEPA
jgi:RNA polymerase sigma-70 factor (ECF subfamily)